MVVSLIHTLFYAFCLDPRAQRGRLRSENGNTLLGELVDQGCLKSLKVLQILCSGNINLLDNRGHPPLLSGKLLACLKA